MWIGAAPLVAAAQSGTTLAFGAEGWGRSGLAGMRGVTVGPIESSQQAGKGYGTAYSEVLLDELQRLGVNWIVVTPYGRMWDLQSVDIRMDFEAPYAANRQAMRRMVQQAHDRGMRVLMVPHIWFDAGGFGVHVDPGSPKRWQRFLANFGDFIRSWARDAAAFGVDMFSVGHECSSFSHRFPEFWNDLIRQVRSDFPGLLTYGANWWEEPERVPFWEQLDLIGISAYYPLAWQDNTAEENRIKAAEALEELRVLSQAVGKPLFFAEVGFMSRKNATVAPFEWPEQVSGAVMDEAEQVKGFSALFDQFLPEPWFTGFFLWRYYANLDDVSQEPRAGFSPHAKSAEAYLGEVFRRRWGTDPDGWTDF